MGELFSQALAPDRWPALVLITARLTGLMFTGPLWSMSALPRSARAAITVVLALALLPLVPTVPPMNRLLDLPVPLAMELVIGLAIGMTAAVIVQGVALAGETLSMQMGLSLSPTLAPMPDIQLSGIGNLQTFVALLVYVSVGGHLMLLEGLAGSLRTLPPGTGIDLAEGGRSAALMLGTVYGAAIRAAAPVMVTLLLTNVALALMSRAVPQLNAMMVSLPITMALGLLMVGISLPIVAATIGGWMVALPAAVAQVVQSFQPAH